MVATLASGPYPVMTRLAREPDIDLDLNTLFEFGLRRLLDGYAVFIERDRA